MDHYTYTVVPSDKRPPICGTCAWYVPIAKHWCGNCTIEIESCDSCDPLAPPSPEVEFWGLCKDWRSLGDPGAH